MVTKIVALAIGLTMTCLVANAQISVKPHRSPLGALWHGIRRHKLEILYDGICFAAEAADAGSSVAAQRTGNATELNGALGPHPSSAATWAYALGGATAIAALNRMIFHYADRPGGDGELRALPMFYTAPMAVMEFRNVAQNARIASSRPSNSALVSTRSPR